jgi:hypothetical protein
MTTDDRDRGILTTDDRDYLTGRKNYSDGSERNTRQRIRDRTRNGLYDFEHLATEVAEKDITQLATSNGTVDEQIFDAAEDAIAFIFMLCRHAPDTEAYTTNDRFKEILRNGIEKGVAEDHTVLDFDLDLQYGLPREARNRIRRKLRHGESLTVAELREALNNEYLDDSYRFSPLDEDGFPKNVDPESQLSHDDY